MYYKIKKHRLSIVAMFLFFSMSINSFAAITYNKNYGGSFYRTNESYIYVNEEAIYLYFYPLDGRLIKGLCYTGKVSKSASGFVAYGNETVWYVDENGRRISDNFKETFTGDVEVEVGGFMNLVLKKIHIYTHDYGQKHKFTKEL